ncbi:hypothetical protein AB395_00003257 [Sinorhizobium fredii CCBAU 45436]|nr:hypothetical protein AB395_00003257 [Sinorhizobium fredii CCBAU 45436]
MAAMPQSSGLLCPSALAFHRHDFPEGRGSAQKSTLFM